jgi:ribosomal protein S18 acetylase RimI-like enzyme
VTAFDEISAITLQMPVQLRIAQSEDISKLEWFGQYRHYRNLFRVAYREQLKGGRLILIAAIHEFPIGHIFIQLKSGNVRIADGVQRAYFYSFRVMEMFRGEGLGSRLVQEAECLIVDRGYRFATIAVAKNNDGALRLYRRLGYQIFASDPGQWSYVDHRGVKRFVEEPCWLLEKQVTD